MIRYDKKEMKEKLQELYKDLDNGEMTASTWIWIIGGAVTGFFASCIKWGSKNAKPILAKIEKAKKLWKDEE